MYTNCHSYYSLRYGTYSEVTLLELAEANNITFIALTDINTTTATLNFLKEAKFYNVWPVIGVDIRNGIDQQYILLAKSNEGFQNINVFLSKHLHEKSDFPEVAPELKDTLVIYPFEKVLELEKTAFLKNEYIGISFRNLNRLAFSKYKSYTDKLVIQQPVTFRDQSDFNAHRLLRCIDLNILLSKLDESEQAKKTDRMIHLEELLKLYADYPYIQENTKRILQSCKVDFFFDDARTNQNQDVYLGSKDEDFDHLEKLCFEKLPERYPEVTDELKKRIEKELHAIKTMGFVSYFLINYDIISYAKSKNYPHIGRGSGANSVVAYVLGITNVDPIDLDLYFERFLNPYRSSPPDFDIDFSWADRDDITHYIFNRFKHTALMGMYTTFQYRAVVRELSKVFGLPKKETDDFLLGFTINPQNTKLFQLIEKYGKLIHGFPNYISVHAGGILILKRPIHYYTATFFPPKGFATVLFDMNIAEDVGIFKFDILAQRGLAKIKDTLEIIKYNQPEADVADLEKVYELKTDPNLNNLLKVGDCIGVFYVESPAMRVLMTKLQTDNYLGLVAASSIIRPGVTNGGMKNQYILRHRFPEKCKEAHPIMLEILHDTYGVMIYQEDVLKVAHKFAGLTLAEADILRRGMRGKTRSKGEFENIEKKFKSNCLKRRYSLKDTEDIWNQIRAFAGYAFAKGHSASYAVESYQCLYLKTYFPLEYLTAVVNNGGGFYNIETYLYEFQRCGGTIELPCVNQSDHPNMLFGTTMYLGFGMLKQLENRAIEKILTERQLYGMYQDFDDFYQRAPIGIEQLIILIKADAFRFTGVSKHELMWNAHLRSNKQKKIVNTIPLFSEKPINFKLPNLNHNCIAQAYDEITLLEFPLGSRFDLLEKDCRNGIYAKDFPKFVNKNVVIYGQLITAKGAKTIKSDTMYFGTFRDKKGTIFDTVHFPNVAAKFSVKIKGVYRVEGKVTEELNYYALIVSKITFEPVKQDPRYHLPENSNKNILLEN